MKYLLLLGYTLVLFGCGGDYTAFNEPIIKKENKRECFVVSYRFGLIWSSKVFYDDLSISTLRRELNYPNDVRKRKSYCSN